MKKNIFRFLALFCLSSFAGANSGLQGFHFEHKDWEIACDNTGTCRMAGYVPIYSDFIGSIHFERKAGEAVLLGEGRILYEQDKQDKSPSFTLWLDGYSLGKIEVNTNEMPFYDFSFTAKQTEKLLAALVGSPKIEIRNVDKRWQISAEGATAVMLKMDEFQQRLDTPTALVRKGESNSPILQPQPLPKVKSVKPQASIREEILKDNPKYERLSSLIKSIIDTEEDCFSFKDEEAIVVYPLSKERKLIGTLCMMAAYNYSMLYLLTDKDEKQIFWYSSDYNDFEDGELSGLYKGRGIGDCMGYKESVWNGETFVLSQEYTTGMCREFPGGAWILPTFVSDVEKADK